MKLHLQGGGVAPSMPCENLRPGPPSRLQPRGGAQVGTVADEEERPQHLGEVEQERDREDNEEVRQPGPLVRPPHS